MKIDERGVSPSYAEEVIRYGSSDYQDNGNTCYKYGLLQVIINKNGAVATIMN